MVRSRISVTPKRSFRVLVIFPFIITGLAAMCAAVPLTCLASVTVLSIALKVGDHYGEFRLPSTQPLLRSDLRNDTAAGLARVPGGLQQGIQFIRFDAPTLAPMAFTRFCMKYPDDREQQQLFGDDRIELNKMRWSELENINRIVNSSIHPERNEDGLAGEK